MPIPYERYFSDAPFYDEGLHGVSYSLRDRHDVNAPGLWIADKSQRLEIATEDENYMPVGATIEGGVISYPATEGDPPFEEARRQYKYALIDIEKGDAIVNHFLLFNSRPRPRGDETKAQHHLNLAAVGALVRFHIPHSVLRDEYEFDGVHYRKKKFRIKFSRHNDVIQIADGTTKDVPKNCDVFALNGRVTCHAVMPFAGLYRRLICGQPLPVFLDTAREVAGINPTLVSFALDLGVIGAGISICAADGLQENGASAVNPYVGVKEIWRDAHRQIRRWGVSLSQEQSGDFNRHYRDILRRYFYFRKAIASL